MLTFRSPFDLFQAMDHIFQNSFESGPDSFGTEILEKDGFWHAQVEVPGFAPEDISVEMDGKYLRVSGRKSGTKSKEDVFASKSLETKIYLGPRVDGEKIQAFVKDGLLTLSAPLKTEYKSLPQKVEVKSG